MHIGPDGLTRASDEVFPVGTFAQAEPAANDHGFGVESADQNSKLRAKGFGGGLDDATRGSVACGGGGEHIMTSAGVSPCGLEAGDEGRARGDFFERTTAHFTAALATHRQRTARHRSRGAARAKIGRAVEHQTATDPRANGYVEKISK